MVIIMFDIAFIVLARAVHVMAGVTWAGATFVLAAVIVPLATRHAAEGAGRWMGLIASRAGMLSGISALLTVLSGIYLFAALHPHDDSTGGLVLKVGSLAALLAMAVGIAVGRPTGRKLAKLQEANAGGAAPSQDAIREMSALRMRAMMSARVATGLLVVAVLAMSVFRYVAAIG